jgi:hypothetical protein
MSVYQSLRVAENTLLRTTSQPQGRRRPTECPHAFCSFFKKPSRMASRFPSCPDYQFLVTTGRFSTSVPIKCVANAPMPPFYGNLSTAAYSRSCAKSTKRDLNCAKWTLTTVEKPTRKYHGATQQSLSSTRRGESSARPDRNSTRQDQESTRDGSHRTSHCPSPTLPSQGSGRRSAMWKEKGAAASH